MELVAVCVCTRARLAMLRRCLYSLRRQNAGRFSVRLFVIDNDAEQSARPVVEEARGSDAAVYVHCPEPGIPFARNAAVEAALQANADYIAFIDDDEVAPPHWLSSLFDVLKQSGADAVQGGVRKAPAGSDLSAIDIVAPTSFVWEPAESLATCNVIFSTRLLRPPLALRFDERMRYTGGSDREFFMHAHKKGARLVVARGVAVWEEIAEGRETLSYQWSRAFAAGNNYVTRMTKHEPFFRGRARIILRALDRGVSGVAKLVLAGLLWVSLQGRAAQHQAQKGVVAIAFAGGCLSPAFGIRAHPYASIQGH